MLPTLKRFYRIHGRSHLPWRKTRDPYKILVSEFMLQQTQVSRVLLKYEPFLTRFPTLNALAEAPLSRVLKEWQGLGYNRRAMYLHKAAQAIVQEHGGRFPKNLKTIENLPGVGHYTARAVAAFAFNAPSACIETNIRTVFLHHYFPHIHQGESLIKVSDREILPLVERDLKRSRMEPREFYAALMDYGAHLKASGVRIHRKSAHYAKQSKFEGSVRQKRAARLRERLSKGASDEELEALLHA